jgi:hypothetical protein
MAAFTSATVALEQSSRTWVRSAWEMRGKSSKSPHQHHHQAGNDGTRGQGFKIRVITVIYKAIPAIFMGQYCICDGDSLCHRPGHSPVRTKICILPVLSNIAFLTPKREIVALTALKYSSAVKCGWRSFFPPLCFQGRATKFSLSSARINVAPLLLSRNINITNPEALEASIVAIDPSDQPNSKPRLQNRHQDSPCAILRPVPLPEPI